MIKSAPGIAKLQIVLAIWGINNLDRYHKSKMDHQKNHLIVNTRFSETAAYLMLHDQDLASKSAAEESDLCSRWE